VTKQDAKSRPVDAEGGRALLPAAQGVLAAIDEGRYAVAGVRGVLRGQLHIGAIQVLDVIDLPTVLARFRQAHPAVTLRLTLPRRAASSKQQYGELDIAFIDGPIDQSRLTQE
jgi:DNA-binding transcriptional LysR family regulator